MITRRRYLWHVVGLCVALTLPAAALADPIVITSGQAAVTATELSGSGPITLVGEDFLLEGRLRSSGRFDPSLQCGGAPTAIAACRPGSRLTLEAVWAGTDMSFHATVEGEEFVGGGLDEASANTHFFGSVILPAWTGGDQLVSAPFTFEGSFFFPPLSGDTRAPLGLTGHGTALVSLTPWRAPPDMGDVGNVWQVTAVVYAFGASADPIPEPGTLLLLGTGLAAAGHLRSRRRGRCKTPQ